MKAKQGYLLMNNGSPNAAQDVDVRRYHKEIMKSPQMTDLPAVLRNRADQFHRSAELSEIYRSIWTPKGSPLIQNCKAVRDALRQELELPVEMGMAFGEPSIQMAVGKLLDAGTEEICVLPLYPQYSVVTVGTCVDSVTKEVKYRKAKVKIRLVPPFYNHPGFIQPLAQPLTDPDEYVLFSCLGLSLHHLKKPDAHGHCMSSMECCAEPSGAHDTCYRFQCLASAREIARTAGISENYSVSFQSRSSHDQWMEPRTEEKLKTLAAHGRKKLAVICPSFICDGLETLEELDIRGRQTFLEAGGESFRRIPCLNASPAGIQCLESLISGSGSWPVIYPEE